MSIVRSARLLVLCAGLLSSGPVSAEESSATEPFSLHAQTTFVLQYHPAFASPYRGANSLDPGSRGDETLDITVYAAARLWRGGEFYIDPEIDQGFGLSGTLGAAGFLSGEAYKVGSTSPYVRVPRVFLRQTFDLRGGDEGAAPSAVPSAGTRRSENLVVTAGKFGVTDIFDTNVYAHDPRADFLNWAIIDAGAFDYAADSWAYTYGAAVEWTKAWWTLRLGVFNLSRLPNSKFLQRDFSQFEVVTEAEARLHMLPWPGVFKALAYVNRGRMADYSEALQRGRPAGAVPELASVRDYASRPGFALNMEQPLGAVWGAFLRLSADDGSKEAYEFTEINRSISGGLAASGSLWGRSRDRVGVAAAVNDLSRSARRYFAAGGLGLLIGDGRLTHFGTEDILEAYYSATLRAGLNASLDYQYLLHPAYNGDRGPVSAFALRLHAEM